MAYNLAHGIEPRGVQKRIKDLIEGVYDTEASHEALKVEQARAAYAAMNEKDLTREVKRVEREMLEAARNLEFERAAQLRDRLHALKKLLFGVVEEEGIPVPPPALSVRPAQARRAVGRRR
jgi:excinuclease ABC subunit B